MRSCALLLVLAACSSAPDPTQVTYVLGGVMSGPYRVTADLTKGIVEQANPPPQGTGGLPPNAWTMPATKSRPLTPQSAQAIRRLARDVAAHGMSSARACPGPGLPTVDALGSFKITVSGTTQQFTAPTPCMTAEASDLLRRMSCAADPAAYGCNGA